MKDVSILTNNGANVKKALELFGDMETYDETLQTFLQEVPTKLAKIKNCKEIGDMANYAILVHSLKSDARYFGFEELGEIAYQHELQSKANNMYFVTENFDTLMTEANRVVNVIKKYMGVGGFTDVTPTPQQIQTPAASTPAPETNSSVQTTNKSSILVVDDSDIIRNFILKIFKDELDVIVANDGKEAEDILLDDNKRANLKAMLLDLNMPNVDGFQVLDFVRDHDLFNKLPISIITGVDDKESVTKAFHYPIVDMLIKPFNERDVKRIVEKTINSKM